MKTKLAYLEKRIGYIFKDKNLLIQALTHRSFAYENQEKNKGDNEVLEFLGDSVLGFILADFLCLRFPDLSEGELSKIKSTAGSTSSLSYFARKIRLDKIILLGKGENRSGGRKKNTILAGSFEALVAALYLDGGIETARKFVNKLLESLFKKIHLKKYLINNYKSALQEHFQRDNLPAPVYKVLTSEGPDHKKCFTVEVFFKNKPLAKAKGYSVKTAEQKAAQKALKNLLGKKIKAFTSDTFLLKKQS
ncbi:MAG: ribonuclease III [Candidatus Aminicenantes bacterium]|nr:ribonuclease III [Candidatus Aminicenantes bacterium]